MTSFLVFMRVVSVAAVIFAVVMVRRGIKERKHNKIIKARLDRLRG